MAFRFQNCIVKMLFMVINSFTLKGFLHRKLTFDMLLSIKKYPYTEFACPYIEVFLIDFIFQCSLSHNIYPIRAEVKIRTLNVNNFCLEHLYTLRYNTFFHIFFMLNNISKVSFLCRNPFK